jgi:hypothetical protein
LPKLLEERRAYYAKKSGQWTVTSGQQEGSDPHLATTHQPPATAPWRQVLATLSQGLHEDTLLAEVWDALEDATTPENVGQALVTRVQAVLTAAEGQETEAESAH